MLTVSGLLWSLYTYEQEMYSAMGTMFMTLNIIVLDAQDLLLRSIGGQHYKTFGEPSEADPTKVAVAEIISAAITKEKESRTCGVIRHLIQKRWDVDGIRFVVYIVLIIVMFQ